MLVLVIVVIVVPVVFVPVGVDFVVVVEVDGHSSSSDPSLQSGTPPSHTKDARTHSSIELQSRRSSPDLVGVQWKV